MTSEAKAPDSSADWEAIDIFVFSNGQQYSPPRKYHLQAEDLNSWKATLNYLARLQYGSLHSAIDLYTIEGKKVEGPLELSNGAAYVAVEPPDMFLNTGYEKYILKASRSWEKRQAKKTNSDIAEQPDERVSKNEIVNLDSKTKDQNIKVREDSTILKTIISSTVQNTPSIVVKPQPITDSQLKVEIHKNSTVKQMETKKPLNQRLSIPKKVSPNISSPTNRKPSFKNRENLKTNIVKITGPANDRHTLNSNDNKVALTKSKIYKPMNRKKESTTEHVLSEVPEVVHDATNNINSSLPDDTNIGRATTNVKSIINSTTETENVTQVSKNVLVSCVLYKNSQKEQPSISLDPSIKEHSQQCEETKPLNITLDQRNPPTVDHRTKGNQNNNNEIKINIPNKIIEDNQTHNSAIPTNSIKHHKIIAVFNVNSAILDIKTAEDQDDTFKTRINVSKTNDRVQITRDSQIQSEPFKQDKLIAINNTKHQVLHVTTEENQNNNRGSETKESTFNDNMKKSSTNEDSPIVSTSTNKIAEEQYVATFNKGDVMNLKLNIEIQKHNNGLNEQRSVVKQNLSTNVPQSEKGSQISIQDENFTQNKSLLCLITKEIHNSRKEGNQNVITVQCACCKYDRDSNTPYSENTKYVVLLPIAKCEDGAERCLCTHELQQKRSSSYYNPAKKTISCMSLERLTKTGVMQYSAETADNDCANKDLKVHGSIEQNSERNISVASKRKSVAINEVLMPNSREPSGISRETVLSEILTIKESAEIIHTKLVDQSTQTEWSNILLEAKLHENGHYTFHLPPIEILKYYKL